MHKTLNILILILPLFATQFTHSSRRPKGKDSRTYIGHSCTIKLRYEPFNYERHPTNPKLLKKTSGLKKRKRLFKKQNR